MEKRDHDKEKESKEWHKTAAKFTGAEWRRRVDLINPLKVRRQAACVVWWDWFGQIKVSERWDDLDVYKDGWSMTDDANDYLVRDALVKIGYPHRLATSRMKLNKGITKNMVLAEK